MAGFALAQSGPPTLAPKPIPAEAPIFSQAKRFSKAINTSGEELMPIIAPTGKTIYFTRSASEQNIGGAGGGQDIWVSDLDEKGQWKTAQNLGKPLNNEYDNAVSHVAAGGLMLYLNNAYIPKKKLMTTGLSYSLKFIKDWSAPKVIKLPGLNPELSFTGYSLSADESILFIAAIPSAVSSTNSGQVTASNAKPTPAPNAKGIPNANQNEDLFVSFKLDTGGFSEPISLGSVINTSGIEFAPWLDPDGRTLYFASTGHKGLGGADVFRSVAQDDSYTKWSTPENLGPAINTKGFDAYFRIAPNAQYAVYVSDSGQQALMTDIFYATVTTPAKILQKEAEDAQALALAKANKQLDSLRNLLADKSRLTQSQAKEADSLRAEADKVLASSRSAKGNKVKGNKTTVNQEADASEEDADGDAATFVAKSRKPTTKRKKAPSKGFDMFAEGAEPAFVKTLRDELSRLRAENEVLKRERPLGEKSDEEKIMDSRPTEERIAYMRQLYKSYPKVADLQSIKFDFNKADLRNNQERKLVGLLEYLNLHPQANIFVYGHTDSIGTVEANERLSVRRAETIKAYLEIKGIDPERVRTIGRGLNFPIASNTTKAGRQQNRRTDIEVRMKE